VTTRYQDVARDGVTSYLRSSYLRVTREYDLNVNVRLPCTPPAEEVRLMSHVWDFTARFYRAIKSRYAIAYVGTASNRITNMALHHFTPFTTVLHKPSGRRGYFVTLFHRPVYLFELLDLVHAFDFQ